MGILVRFICVNFRKINNSSFTQLKPFQNEPEIRFTLSNTYTFSMHFVLFISIVMNGMFIFNDFMQTIIINK